MSAKATQARASRGDRMRANLHDLAVGAHEVVRPKYQRTPTPPEAVPTLPKLFVGDVEAPFEERLADLERGYRRAMGPAALRGIEWGVRIGLSSGGIVSLALAFVPGMLLPLPALGVIVVASSMVLGFVIGASVQAICRARANRHHPDLAQEVLKNLQSLEAELRARPGPQNEWPEAQKRQLRRIELLREDIHGGLAHAGWQLVFAITNVDPRLRVLIRKKVSRAAAQRAAS